MQGGKDEPSAKNSRREVRRSSICFVPSSVHLADKKINLPVLHSPLFRLRTRTILRNVPLLRTVVACLISCWLGTVSGDMAHLSTVEATAVLGPCFIDYLSSITFESRVLAVSGNMPSLGSEKREAW
jgi:hypothetical protein